MYYTHSPGMNRKIWGIRLILRHSPERAGFCVYSRLKMDHKDGARQSYGPVYAYANPLT